MRRLMRLRLKGSSLGGRLLLCWAPSGMDDDDDAMHETAVLGLSLHPVTGWFSARTCGDTACRGIGMMGAIITTTISFYLALLFLSCSSPGQCRCSPYQSPGSPSFVTTSLWCMLTTPHRQQPATPQRNANSSDATKAKTQVHTIPPQSRNAETKNVALPQQPPKESQIPPLLHKTNPIHASTKRVQETKPQP